MREHNAYGNLPVPSHPEHRAFLGWYTQKEGGKLVQPSDFLTEYRDHTLYAHWHNKNTSALKPVAKGAKPDKLDGQPNAGYQSYKVWINWDETDCSYLYENEKGGLTRVQSTRAHRDAKVTDVLVEEYDKDNNVTATLHIEPELPIWGGFFCGEAYNFLFFGQRNDAEDDTAEVIRVVRYDKLWNRIDHASVRNVGVVEPFAGGRPIYAEKNSFLFGHTSRGMYQDKNGVSHGSNMSFVVNEYTMEIAFAGSPAYTSHTFNQMVIVDAEGRPVLLDHGDSFPRAIKLTRFSNRAMLNGQLKNGAVFEFEKFPGERGDNYTGACVTGLAETEKGYLVAYCYDGDADHTRDEIGKRSRDLLLLCG